MNKVFKANIENKLNTLKQIKHKYPESLESAKLINGRTPDIEILNKSLITLVLADQGNLSAIDEFQLFDEDNIYNMMIADFEQIIKVNSVIDGLQELNDSLHNDDNYKYDDYLTELQSDQLIDYLNDEDFELKEKIEDFRNIY